MTAVTRLLRLLWEPEDRDGLQRRWLVRAALTTGRTVLCGLLVLIVGATLLTAAGRGFQLDRAVRAGAPVVVASLLIVLHYQRRRL